MKILLVGQTKGYFFHRLQEAAATRGHEVIGVSNRSLRVDFTQGGYEAFVAGISLEDFDVIHLFVLGSQRWPWVQVAGYFAKKRGTLVVDHTLISASFQDFSVLSEYHRQQEQGIAFPVSVYCQSAKEAKRAAEKIGYPLIIKTNKSKKGRGVGLAKAFTDIQSFIDDQAGDGVDFILRELIPNDGDIRVIVIDGKAVGAVKRTPRTGEFRANLSQGGTGTVFDLTSNSDVQEIALRATQAVGYDVAGVDIMLHKKTNKPYILEVNRAPQFDPFEGILGVDLFTPIIKMYEQKLQG